MVLNKMDLLPYVPFDIARAEENARRINPRMEIVRISCLQKTGLEEWMSWLGQKRSLARAAKTPTA
jgi:hydrogenase nickel incorporation protein HypB